MRLEFGFITRCDRFFSNREGASALSELKAIAVLKFNQQEDGDRGFAKVNIGLSFGKVVYKKNDRTVWNIIRLYGKLLKIIPFGGDIGKVRSPIL